jgi:ElaB/YqjD/DUF883 family membrane-anchored ribosome-binding protein
MTANTERDVENLKSEFADLKSDVSELTETIKSMSGNTVRKGRERTKEAVATVAPRPAEIPAARESDRGD